MFGNKREIANLRADMKVLADRLYKVEAALEPFRVGQLSHYMYGLPDYRPQVTLKRAIEQIMAHLGMEFCHTPAQAEQVFLCKPKK